VFFRFNLFARLLMKMHSKASFLRALSFFIFVLLALPASAQSTTDFTAEILRSGSIIAEGASISSAVSPSDFSLTRMDGSPVEISHVLPRRAHEVLLIPAEELDYTRLHTLKMTKDSVSTLVRRNEWFKTLYSEKPLGAVVSDDESTTTFRLFAPRASQVKLHLFLHIDQELDRPQKSVKMKVDANGVWEAVEAGNHHGVFYTFTVHGPAEPGNYFFETHPVHVTDPYALVSDDSFGKAMVFKPGPPPMPVAGGRPRMEDVVAYEVHIQDFTDALPFESELQGTFRGMMSKGLTNETGAAVGFDYLTTLGINVVHLMPVQEFLHYPDDEWQTAFQDDEYMRDQGIAMENYQWGYRTTHALAVESRYRTENASPGDERQQFKDLVAAFHKEGISVIIDVVPNHTGENMDGRHYLFNFNAIDLPYYYRTDKSLKHIGPFGNETKPEDRPMVQRWMLDQLQHFVEVLGVDGFRIDLAGQIDEQTLIWLKSELPDDLIIYGEAWIAPSDPLVRADPDLSWYKIDSPITYFQDDARNAFKGPVSNPENPLTDRGFAGGDAGQRERAMMGLLNSFEEEIDPNRGINYLDIHDNWALADRFSNVDWDGRKHVDEAAFRLAATLLFTSLGPVVIHGGTEMMRSKAHAPLEELIKSTSSGELALHGKRDTYNLRRANGFVWSNVGTSTGLGYDAMVSYWKGLISFRMNETGSVFRVGGVIDENTYQWILPENDQLLGYVVDSNVLILINTSTEPASFNLESIPGGRWEQISDGASFEQDGCDCDQDLVSSETRGLSIVVSPQSAPIWVRSTSELQD